MLWLLALGMWSTLSLAQDTRFQRSFGGSGAENSYSIRRTLDGGFINVGYTTSYGAGQKDVYMVKTNGLGQIQWSKAYGGQKDDVGWKVTLASDSGFVVAGTTESYNSNNQDALIFKTDKNGSVVWTRTFAGDSAEDAYSVIRSVFSNGYYVIGYVKNDSTGDDAFIAKLGSLGNVRWYRKFGSPGNEEAYGVAEDAQGNVIVCGMTTYDSITQGGTSGFPGNSDVFLAKFDSTGNYKWTKAYGNNGNDVAWDLKADKNNYILTGWTRMGTGDDDIMMMVTDTSGSLANLYTFGTMGHDRAFSITVHSGSEYSITGYSDPQGNDRDVFYMKVTLGGNMRSYSLIGGADRDGHWPTDVTVARDGGIAMLSTTRSFKGSSTDDDLYLIKADEGGIVNCNSNFELVNQTNTNFGSTSFGSITTGFGSQTPSLTTTTISGGHDTTLCCKLVAETAGDSFQVCEGTSVSLGRDRISGMQYAWTDDKGASVSNLSNPSVAPKSTTTYKLVVSSTDGACAPDSSYVKVKVNQRIQYDFARDTSFCDKDSVFFSTLANLASYSWTGTNISSSTQTIKLKKKDTLYFRGLDVNNCVYLDTMKVTVFSLPTFNLGVDTTICENTPITLSGPANMASYNWNNGAGSARTYTTNVERTHTLVVIDQNGCTAADSRDIYTNPFSTFSLGPDDMICEGGSYTILGPGALGNYIWNDTASSLQNLKVNAPGTYRLTAFNSFGCPYTDTIVLTQRAAPKFSLGNDFKLCVGSSRYLVGPSEMKKYTWASGSDNDSLRITTSGVYSLTVRDSFDCTFTDSITVGDAQNPVVSLGNDTTICVGDSLVLTPGSFITYDWSTGSTQSSIVVKAKGTYSVDVIDENGCAGNGSIAVDTMTCPDGIAGIAQGGIKVYPIPAHSELSIDLEANEPLALTIRLMSITGSVLYSKEVQLNSGLNELHVPLDGLSGGMYFLNLNNRTGSSTLKVWVE
ncbi:MAG: T9SS type A sorting domain-containing protein [Flavobacteriales bacterium]|nr:T9SS type A sorting domain-containing protein [Bacteroidota bacterium]MCB9241284.1 T9SS type A sorting domain-containing protein [Flavobacteriales bacterium]